MEECVMNMSRVALAAVVAWVVDGVYGFAVYGKALEGEFARYPGVFRPMEAVMGNLPLMFAGGLVAMCRACSSAPARNRKACGSAF